MKLNNKKRQKTRDSTTERVASNRMPRRKLLKTSTAFDYC